ncbi:putative enoyl-CoA hydratase echA8 [Rhodobacteraceae bacterium THAF1]|uniref:enoyl-CoA hydratase n=1 Tax=Palleronia sp. THAF1 TaxID=2587842 RepID=UPI000F3F96E4|nr:enoyl-CoA hydratase [Palleronia sp. THAF1]QFU08511.1 putative enoyl-CoA hydratase echA8 [Palleronia sp. THAF1]VDC28598.1 putative enoyl-CoA hydratase echA8 [Rhodobacteraceae bacterium THAF1]
MLKRERHGAILRLVMDAPERLNALSDAMLAELSAAFADLETDQETRVVILSGAGRAFCAGHDLKEMQAHRADDDGGAAAWHDLFTRCGAVMQAIPRLPQPVIAEVQGVAAAAGCQLVASCDMAVAAEGTKFGVNGVNIGLFCSTPMVALSRVMPRKAVFEMLTTGRLIEAEEAQALGLINRIAPAESLANETMALAETIASKLGSAVRVGKRAFYEQAEMGLADAYDHTGRVMVQNMLDADTGEGIDAFLGKRAPEWSQD